jgi:ribosomal protein S18 acetylase RimI-like enzyme
MRGMCSIRPFRETDEPQVVALWKSVFGYAAPHNDPATVIRQKMRVDPDLFLVASVENWVVGTVMGGYDGHRGWIYSLAVDPTHRRRGTATALVRQVESRLAERGCLKVNLQVLASNAQTMSFYQKLGYSIEERVSMGKLLRSSAEDRVPSPSS